VLLAVAIAPLGIGASLVDVVKRKRTNKAAELYTVDADGQNLGAAVGKDDISLNDLWNEAQELEFIDDRLLTFSSSMSIPVRVDLPPSGDEGPPPTSSGDGPPPPPPPPSGDRPPPPPPSGDRPPPPPPSEDRPPPPPPSEDRPSEPSEPTTPPEPSEPTTPPEPSEPTTSQPTFPSNCLEGTTREDFLLQVLSDVTDPALLGDPATPQGEAFEFLVNDDFDPCSYPVLQRYALSVLYYSTEGGDWNENEGWVQPGVNECEWFNVTCGDADSVVSIHLGKLFVRGALTSFYYGIVLTYSSFVIVKREQWARWSSSRGIVGA